MWKAEEWTTIPVSRETKKRFKARLRGGESQDELLGKMVEQYDPEGDGG